MTQQKLKVYELAKELGMESMALLEKLKSLDVEVKSHMSALGTEEVRIVRDQLAKEKAQAAKLASKKGGDSTEKRVGGAVIRRRTKSTAEEGTETPAVAEEKTPPTAPAKTGNKTITRRKAAAPVTTEEETPSANESVQETAPVETPVEQTFEQPEQEQSPAQREEAVEESVVVATEEMNVAPEESPLAATPAPEADPAVEPAAQGTLSSAPTQKESGPPPVGSKGFPKASGFSFDIIKVIPKSAGQPATPEEAKPAPKTIIKAPTIIPPVRPKATFNVVSKAAPGSPESMGSRTRTPFTNRHTYHRPAGASGAHTGVVGGLRPGMPRPASAGGGHVPGFTRPGVAPAGGLPLTPFPLPSNTKGRDGHDKNRNMEEELSKKKSGLSRIEKEELPVEDIKLLDYRAKKELVFLPKKKKIPTNRELNRTQITKAAAHKRVVKIEDTVSVSDLANRMSVKATDVIKKLVGMGVMANINQKLDYDTALLVAQDFGFEVENVAFKEDTVIQKADDKDEDKLPRPPIVTVMGHVDHGKTSLLDAIRKSDVVAGEAGGITQHIGAYTVNTGKNLITFIDTPGHEAFTLMRARGANVTDIVILVVAADDGIMPQTREAIAHAKSAGVPILVAINKIDKPTANREKVLKQLAELDLLPEEWGGQTMVVNVSATQKKGIPELLDGILLQSEVLELKANPNRLAEGSILEAKLDKNKGPTATVIIKKGTLKVGDMLVAGVHTGRIKAMLDSSGKNVSSIGPSIAAEILGLENVPMSGDNFNAVASDAEAQQLQSHRLEEVRKKEASKQGRLTLEEIFGKIQKGDLKELPIILKTDVFGSTEAIKESLVKLSNQQVKVKILSASVGGITESDVLLASASGALIIGFNVRPDTKARSLAEQEHIEVKTYSIIYELLDDVRKAMAGLLPKKAVERYLGRAEVRNTFSIPSIGVIAGTSVIDGKVSRQSSVRLLRENRIIFTGKISSLKRFKDDAREVAQGFECGIGIENYRDIKIGDIIEAFTVDMVTQELDTSSPAPDSNKSNSSASQASV